MSSSNINKTKIIIGLGLIVGTISTIILIRKRIFGKKLFNYISSKLENRENLYGNIKDFTDVFSGNVYIEKVSNMVKNNYPNLAYIKLKDEFVTKYRKELYDAMEAGKLSNLYTGFGTDEEKVVSIIKSLKDKVALAQVAESYKNAYNKNLLDVLVSELGINSNEIEEIYNSIIIKLPYRLTNKN
jgi:hypothetical protein